MLAVFVAFAFDADRTDDEYLSLPQLSVFVDKPDLALIIAVSRW